MPRSPLAQSPGGMLNSTWVRPSPAQPIAQRPRPGIHRETGTPPPRTRPCGPRRSGRGSGTSLNIIDRLAARRGMADLLLPLVLLIGCRRRARGCPLVCAVRNTSNRLMQTASPVDLMGLIRLAAGRRTLQVSARLARALRNRAEAPARHAMPACKSCGLARARRANAPPSPPSGSASNRGRRSMIAERILMGLLLGGVAIGCVLVLYPFFSALLWAGILVFTTWPVYDWLRLHLRLPPDLGRIADGAADRRRPGAADRPSPRPAAPTTSPTCATSSWMVCGPACRIRRCGCSTSP